MKPRVIFPYTEAGLGHITPMNSIADEFEKLYGDKVEVVRSQFFSETGNKKLMAYEKKLTHAVKSYNRNPVLGFLATCNMDLWGTRIVSACSISLIGEGATKVGIEHMRELKPDLVISTHWATNYYAMKMRKDRPLTAMYCPDAKTNTLFRYPCDLAFISTKTGYKRGVTLHRRRFNEKNFKLVPFLIRKEAFEITGSKAELREKLGLEDRFTVLLAEGGYGVGKIKEVVKRLIERDLPINIIAVCGKNEKLYNQMKEYKTKGNARFLPFGLVDNMLEIIAASDLSVGKSGASLMAEPCYFGVPQLITHYANDIERWIGNYYIKTVGSAIKQFNAKKAADLIGEFYADPSLLEPYIIAAKAQHDNYGAEKCARYCFGLLCTRYPELKDGTEIY